MTSWSVVAAMFKALFSVLSDIAAICTYGNNTNDKFRRDVRALSNSCYLYATCAEGCVWCVCVRRRGRGNPFSVRGELLR